jgi:hypothetical protein
MSSPDRPRVVLVGAGPHHGHGARRPAGRVRGCRAAAGRRGRRDRSGRPARRTGGRRHVGRLAPAGRRTGTPRRGRGLLVRPHSAGRHAGPAAPLSTCTTPRCPVPRRATVNWAIINGDPDAHISIHCLAPELDAGGVLFAGSAPIRAGRPVSTLYDRLNELQRQHIAAAVQRRSAVTTASRRTRARPATAAPGCPTTGRSSGRPRRRAPTGWCGR